MIIHRLQSLDASIKFQSKRLQRALNKRQLGLYEFIDSYFDDYCVANNIDMNQIVSIREKFSTRYLADLERFSTTGLYPSINNIDDDFALDRVEYDIILILSFLLEPPRFFIADWLSKNKSC